MRKNLFSKCAFSIMAVFILASCQKSEADEKSVTEPSTDAALIAAIQAALANSELDDSTDLTNLKISGSISGLTGSGLILQNNGGDNLAVTSGASSFTFTSRNRAGYNITVATQPTGPYCAVTNASGTIAGANVSNVVITCASKKLFTTTVTGGANFGGHSGADSRCMSDTNYPGTGTYKAMLVDNTRTACTTANCSGGTSENLNWVLQANRTYNRVSDGATVGTTTSARIFTFPLTNVVGGAVNNIWTALKADWTTGAGTCSNWTSNSNAISAFYGYTQFTDSGSIHTTQSGLDTPAPCDGSTYFPALLCVEQ